MKTVVIIDKAEVPSKGVVFSLISRHPRVKIVNLEKVSTYYFHPSLSKEPEFLSINYLDVLNRDSVTNLLQGYISRLPQGLVSSDLSTTFPTCIVIDSVNQLELLTSTNKCLEFIRDLENNEFVDKIICVIHQDSLTADFNLLRQIIHVSETTICVNSLSKLGKYNLSIQKKSSSGKVTNTEEELFYDTEKKIWKSNEIKETERLRKVQTKILPHDVASFKISIDDSAKLVKNDMILPYTEVLKGSAKIEYEEDEAIEWDDEDPDEDLDI